MPKRSACLATTTVCDATCVLLRLEILCPHIGLVVEPDLRDENSEQAENDGKPDHDDGAGTHGNKPRLTRPKLRGLFVQTLEARQY